MPEQASVLGQRCEFVYRRLGPALLACAALSILLAAALWDSRPTEIIVFWLLVMALLICASALLWQAHRRAAPPSEAADPWVRRLAIAAAGLGAGWGFAAAVFFPGGEGEQVLVAFAVALVASGAVAVFSTLWWIYAIFAAAALLPFGVVLFAYGSEFLRWLGAAVPLLYAANVASALQLGRTFSAAYGLRDAYQKLSDENADTQMQLGEQLDSLLEAHREVQSAARKLSLFSERAPIAVLELDPNGTILDLNPAAQNLFGYAAPELAGRNCFSMLLAPEEREATQGWWDATVAAGQPATKITERCLRRDGLELACEWTVTPLADDAGRATSVVMQGRDITQQRTAERVRSEFTSTLSHELRTPLTSILGSLQLLTSGALGGLDKDQTELVDLAERNGQRLLDLINEVLDIEKLESGRLSLLPEPLALDELVRESLKLNQGYADRFQVRLALAVEPPRLDVRADRKRLMQVMTNLLSNAAKFSPPGDTVAVAVQRAGDLVRVSVSDRGPGIPEKFRTRIFGRFAQADLADSHIKGGAGLGLAICKRLIEMMQGHIGFEDRVDGGTTFFFDLPVMRDEEAAADDAVRVLVSEHDTVSAEYLAMVLEKGGYRVDMAADAGATRALLARWNYAVWLLSRRLGDAADSLGLIAEMRPQLANTRVIMLAGPASDGGSVAQAEQHGICQWLSKSDSRMRILEVVGQAIRATS
jgi:PAS domain S-box-containing protein